MGCLVLEIPTSEDPFMIVARREALANVECLDLTPMAFFLTHAMAPSRQ
jgi:hypothetical protein